ncbi:MAG: hypothetical protein CL509_06425 [Actinobacteria bacterium]|nr:hypothetical protein [Actinomycetota bacterium]|tara:strand:+ start:1337 stop:1642 length:306 start_codon:yes stop_codon:yes gene_type:complete
MTKKRKNSRTRRLGDNGRSPEIDKETRDFWHGANPLPDSPPKIHVTEEAAAVIRSLGDPPLGGQSESAEHYFEAVYQRSVALASALAAAAEMVGDDEDDAR